MKQNYLKALLFIAAAMVTAQSKAQLVNCNVFMKGRYIEVGVNTNGAYGTSAPAPAGYFTDVVAGTSPLYNNCDLIAHTDTTRLGFCADPAMDGWTVGSPAFFGDYFAPGIPQEGWSIMADGAQANNWNFDDLAAPGFSMFNGVYTRVPAGFSVGSNVSYSVTGSQVSTTWLGSYDSIAIQQVSMLDTNDLFFTVTVTLTNLATTPRSNVYYLRTVDPDNDVAQSGSFVTYNKIEAQLPNPANQTIVSAAGTMYPDAYLAMGTTDTRAKAFFRKDNFGPYGLLPNCGTLDIIYAATDTFDYMQHAGDTLTADVGIGLVFNIGHLSAVDSTGGIDSTGRTTAATHPNRAVISYYYSFRNNDTGTLGVRNVTNDAAIKVFPNPASNTMNITGLHSTDRVIVYDIMGRATTGSWQVSQNGTNTFNVSALPAGSYIITVYGQDGTIRSRKPLQKQ